MIIYCIAGAFMCVCVSLNWAKIILKYSISCKLREKKTRKQEERSHTTYWDPLNDRHRHRYHHTNWNGVHKILCCTCILYKIMFTSIEHCHLFVFAAQCVRKLHSHIVTYTIWLPVITLCVPLSPPQMLDFVHNIHTHTHIVTLKYQVRYDSERMQWLVLLYTWNKYCQFSSHFLSIWI